MLIFPRFFTHAPRAPRAARLLRTVAASRGEGLRARVCVALGGGRGGGRGKNIYGQIIISTQFCEKSESFCFSTGSL